MPQIPSWRRLLSVHRKSPLQDHKIGEKGIGTYVPQRAHAVCKLYHLEVCQANHHATNDLVPFAVGPLGTMPSAAAIKFPLA